MNYISIKLFQVVNKFKREGCFLISEFIKKKIVIYPLFLHPSSQTSAITLAHGIKYYIVDSLLLHYQLSYTLGFLSNSQ